MSFSARASTPTLLVFTLGPRREQQRRRLLPAAWAREERSLHRQCLRSALAAGAQAECELLVSSPGPLALPPGIQHHEQEGRCFGERLGRAMADSRGEGPLLVVGTDVPQLASRHLRQAVQRLGADSRKVVLGPSPDGGIYLLATLGPAEEVFSGLRSGVRWCGRRTRRSLIRAFRNAGWQVELLEPLGDLDRRQDLAGWLRRAASARWRSSCAAWLDLVHRLRALLAGLSQPPSLPFGPVHRPVLVRVSPGRAPPR